VLVGQGRVITLSRLHRAKIARRHPLREASRVRATQFNLSLASDIPQLHMFFEVPVILLDSSLKRFGQQSVIDDRVPTDAERLDTVGIGCTPVAPRDRQTRRHGQDPALAGPPHRMVMRCNHHWHMATLRHSRQIEAHHNLIDQR